MIIIKVTTSRERKNMAAVYMHIRQRAENVRRNRVFRDRNNPLDYMDDDQIVRRYRLSRPLILELCRMFENDLARPTARSRAFPVSFQIMVALRFYATGSFQMVNADVHNISRPSVSKITSDVTSCLKRVCRNYIKMPTDQAGLHNIMRGFYEKTNFPNVVGAIDGTHIRIKSPAEDEHLYVNRKNYHSINVQAVCDSSMKFLNIVAKYPGATHDSFILTNSNIYELFDSREIGIGWLLGDSGYPLRPWLMTPMLNASTEAEERYNRGHMRARCVVERSFGLLKSRFRCIDNSAGTLLYGATKSCDITVGVAVLHNMCINHGIPLPPDENHCDRGHIARQQYVGHLNDGATVRRRLINGRFSQ